MSLIFYCNQCQSSFNQFKRLAGHYESKHASYNERHRKIKDLISYAGADSGCEVATKYLGYQSHCLECPFPECVEDNPKQRPLSSTKRHRDEEIESRWKRGEDIKDLAVEFAVSTRTIQRAIKGME